MDICLDWMEGTDLSLAELTFIQVNPSRINFKTLNKSEWFKDVINKIFGENIKDNPWDICNLYRFIQTKKENDRKLLLKLMEKFFWTYAWKIKETGFFGFTPEAYLYQNKTIIEAKEIISSNLSSWPYNCLELYPVIPYTSEEDYVHWLRLIDYKRIDMFVLIIEKEWTGTKFTFTLPNNPFWFNDPNIYMIYIYGIEVSGDDNERPSDICLKSLPDINIPFQKLDNHGVRRLGKYETYIDALIAIDGKYFLNRPENDISKKLMVKFRRIIFRKS